MPPFEKAEDHGGGEEVISPKFVLQIIILAFQRMLMDPSGRFPLGPLKATEGTAMVD